MTQYSPMYKAIGIPEINRPINTNEYDTVMEYLFQFNFEEVFYQPLEENAKDIFVPDFTKQNPFI